MTTKKISMNYNLSEQDLINYNQTNFSIENNNNIINNNTNDLNISGSSNDKSNENLIEIELKNIHMLILQRSLYTLKRRFQQNKKDIEFIYEKYKDKNYKNLKCINTQRLFDLYKEIMGILQINLLPYENFNELITADLMSGFNKEKYITMVNALVRFTRKNIEKYNTLFYENKLKKKKMKEEQKNKKNPKPEPVEATEKVKIVHKGKRGEIIDDFEKMIENNKNIKIEDMVFTINEDDMSILINKQLLYTDVIPLIIADFLQEYMKSNIYIGIILSNSFTNDNEDLNELNESIKSLYDKEIIKKYNNLNKIDPKEEKKEKLKNLLYESNNIDTQIKLYKELIVENSNKGIESSYLVEMIRKLKEKKLIIEKKIHEINKRKYFLSNVNSINSINSNEQYFNTLNTNNNLISIENNNNNIYHHPKMNKSKNNSKNNIVLNPISKRANRKEIRESNLFEIFSFYSKQHSLLGKTPTIDSVLQKEKHMNLSEFANFCKEFQIMVKTKKINELFLKYTKGVSYMSFNEFKEALSKMAVLVNEEKKAYIQEKINVNELNLMEIIEKEKKKKKKKKKKIPKNIQKENNSNEEIKNDEVNNNEKVKNVNETNGETKENKEENKEENKNEKKEEINNGIIQDNKEDNKEDKKEDDKKSNKLSENNILINDGNKGKDIKKKQTKRDEQLPNINSNPSINTNINTKEELEQKIAQLKNDYAILEKKTQIQLEEEFYLCLGIDDSSIYRKKMKGYVQPFLTRGKDTRNPEKNVKYPIKFNPKNIRDMYDLLMQRSEDLKKEKELKKIKEKDIQFEKRKKKFSQEIKKLEKDYGDKIKKDNYQQIKKSEEDYLKEKNNKLTWNIIQKCDYQSFLLNEDSNNSNSNMNNLGNKNNKVGRKKKLGTIQSHIDDIFVDQSNILFEKDDEDFINKVYSNQTRKQRQNFDNYIYNSRISPKHKKTENFVNNNHISIDSNKRYLLGKKY